MTQTDLEELDKELDNGEISEDDYLSRLRDEVSAIHRDLSEEDVSNMFKMQLRIMAVDEVLNEENNVSTSRECHFRLQNAEITHIKKELDEKTAAQILEDILKQEAADKQKAQQNQENADNRKSEEQNSQDSQNKQENSNSDDSKDQSKNNSNSKNSGNVWWTYQIVPDWSVWMKTDATIDKTAQITD